MNNNIEIENGVFGKKAIIKTEWQSSFLKFLLHHDVKELELNDGKGWRGKDIDFLEFLPDLRSLTIIHLNIKSIEAIHYLSNLRKLKIITYCKKPIDFHSFPMLLECSFEWIKGSESLFDMVNIQKLSINRYKGKSSEIFSNLINLQDLSISNSLIENLHGLSTLCNLEYLHLVNLKKLISLQGIESLQKIKELTIQSCKGISAIYQIFGLTGLKRVLLLDLGKIESIKGIEKLSELEEFLFYESTNIIDGDISPLFSLKNLKNISFQNRRHYTHKREDFGELYM